MKVQNAKQMPKVYYGLHMEIGVAEYFEFKGKPRLYVTEEVCKQMDATFPGCPVYVSHVEKVNVDEIQAADGYVVESFFNKSDGKHWAKFIVVSDRGHDAIENKHWKLSNSYHIDMKKGGGRWHGVEYDLEVLEAHYDHLAIVQNPRYESSVILTPDEFKEYNLRKEQEMLQVANSKPKEKKKEKKGMFNFLKTEKVDNGVDLENLSVQLPKSRKTVELTKIINEYDQAQVDIGKPMYANGDHLVKVGDEEMTVNGLLEKYQAKNEADKEKEKLENEADPKKDDDKPENEADKDEDKPENEIDEEKRQNAVKNFNKVKNAPHNQPAKELSLSSDRVAVGKSRYGSN